MSLVISPSIPFPNIYWWSVAATRDEVCIDTHEHFEKMTYRNRYYITGSNGLIQLSVPLSSGRDQRNAMKDIGISNKDRWQVQHWRTLTSVYGRAPYFGHYMYSLQMLFDKQYEHLTDFNLDTIQWLKTQLSLSFTLSETQRYQKQYDEATDLRKLKPYHEKHALPQDAYYQLFSERNGFLPNLSILDLLFSEGPYAMQWIKANPAMVEQWK